MATLVMDSDRGAPDGKRDDGHDSDDRQRRLRGRNIVVAAILGAVVVLFYIVAIVKMSGG